MKLTRIWLALAMQLAINAIACNPAFADEDGAIVLQRSGEWSVHRQLDVCYVRGDFAGPGGTSSLLISRSFPTSWFDLTILSSNVSDPGSDPQVTLQFNPYERQATYVPSPGWGASVNQLRVNDVRFDGQSRRDALRSGTNPPPILESDEQAVDRLILRTPAQRLYRFELGSMAGPMRELRNCVGEMVRSWGYDPAVLENIAQTPVPANNPGNWVTQADYPPGDLRAGSRGTVVFRADVGTSGRVESCTVTESSAPESLNRLTCELIVARAQFRPAMDAAGTPMRAFYFNRVRWMTF